MKWAAKKFFVTTEEEPLFDAADVLRFGRDLVVQHGFTTNLKGIEWLRRHFPDHRVHTVNFPGDPYPIHIDATFTPLRPGLILNNPHRRLPEEQRKMYNDNGWEIVDARNARAQFASAALLFLHMAQHERAGARPQNRLRREIRSLSGRADGQTGHGS